MQFAFEQATGYLVHWVRARRYILVKVALNDTPTVFLTYDSFVFFVATDHVLFIVSIPVCHGAEVLAMKAGK